MRGLHVRQPNVAFVVYPVVGLLTLAAAVPILSGSLAGGAPVETAAAPSATPPRIVVSSSAPRIADQPAPPATVGQPLSATPTPVASGADDRWWRAQLDKLGTLSVVRLPQSAPKPAPAPVIDRAQREAAQRETAALAAQVAAPAAAAVAPPALSLGDVRLSDKVPAAIRRWEPLIARAARKYDLDPSLIAALMQTESGGNPNAVSPMHAIGLLQVLDGPFDPEQNIDQGASMLAAHLKRFGNLNLALAAYNAGPNAVAQYGGIPPYDETYNHVTRTLASYAAFRG